ncbi:MAG: dihydromonapterin reductase [Aestuariibacter sp.]
MSPVIITGGAQRLGLHAAIALKELGYDVLITYRSPRPELSQWQEQGIVTLQADFATNDGITQFIESIQAQYSSIRAIVHNASSWWTDDENDPVETFDAMMQVHAKAPYLINHQLSSLLNGDKADIIHLTDLVAQIGSDKHIAYAASKAALENMVFSFARKLAPRVKVNGIAPALLKFNEDDSDSYRDKSLKKSLLQNEPGWQESTETIKYLLNSDFVTGRILALDGGRHLNFK